jgi:hypothetical protein
MKVYVVVQMRCGDIVSMHKMFTERLKAFEYLSKVKDTETSWWKILEFEDSKISVGMTYDVVTRVSWDKSNRATIEEIYDHGYDIPRHFNGRHYFVDYLLCE